MDVALIFTPEAINSPRHLDREDKHFSKIPLLPNSIYIFSLFQTPKKKKKKNQSSLILTSPPRTQGIVFEPNLHFLGSTSWIWGLGVWM